VTSTDPAHLRAIFDAPAPLTVGIEEEVMLLDPETLDLAPRAEEVLAASGADPRFKLELPAAQLELLSRPCDTVTQAAEQIRAARADLTEAAAGIGRLAAAGTHPTAGPEGVLNQHERYRFTQEEFGPVAGAQLVFGLHVHVRVSGADRAVAIHNALRSYLPDLAALAANAPFHAGRDTGLASVRPKLSELLPRQGVPPAPADLGELARDWDWGATAGTLPRPSQWWWELRLHPILGTVEVRVPDQQTTVGETAAMAAVVHSLVATLAARFDAGEPLPVHPGWRIEENRWSAGRHGVEGTLADLDTGEPRPARDRLRDLLSELAPAAERVGCSEELHIAGELIRENGALRQRKVSADGDLTGVVAWLSDRFLDPAR
jgi:carboxylate-amine ligase